VERGKEETYLATEDLDKGLGRTDAGFLGAFGEDTKFDTGRGGVHVGEDVSCFSFFLVSAGGGK
jgi:hypothetical protein